MHFYTFEELRLMHLVQYFLESMHGLCQGDIVESNSFSLGVDVDLIEGLVWVELLKEVHEDVPQLQKDITLQDDLGLIQFEIIHMNSNQNPAINGVSEYLRQLAEKRPNTTQISLQFKSITDLLPYLHLLDRFERLRKLSLHGNRIRELPTDLSVLKNLEQLDLTNNLLDQNIQMTIISLKTIPKLRVLQYQVKKQKQRRIVQEIKTLEYLNNTKVLRQKAKVPYQFQNATEKSLWEFGESLVEKFRVLMEYQRKYLGQVIEVDADERFRQQLNQISKECLSKLSMGRDQATYSLENIMLYMTKFDMFQLLKIRSLNICMDIYSDLGKLLKTILEEEDRLFKQTSEMALSLARIELDQKQKEEEERYNNQFQAQNSIVNKNAVMQKELKRMRKQKDQLIGQMSQLQSHNQKVTEFIVKASKGQNISPKNMPPIQTFQSLGTAKNKEQANQSVRNTLGVGGVGNRTPGIDKSLLSMNANRDHHVNASQASYNTGSTKGLTLKQLKDVIEEIYESKLKFDDKNYQGKLARQTMNQYLFTYLNQKYGLKSLTLEAANNIVSGIQEYSAKDNDIAVFGKILRNEVDEEFRFVQAELKTTIHDLLKMHIKAKMPYKNTAQINEAMNKRINGQISYDQCQDLIRYLYNKNDAAAILRKLQTSFTDKRKDQTSHRRRQTQPQQISNRGKIQFAVFLQQVLNFQLRNHERLLRPLVNSFKKRDKDSDGIIGEEQFVTIIEDLCEDAHSLVPSLLDIIDPYQTKVITFTQMVRLVANYPEENPILNRYAQKNTDDYTLEELDR